MDPSAILTIAGRSLSSWFVQCASSASSGQHVILSIDDITSGEGEYLLNASNQKGGPVAMLKWAKGSKNGGHHSSSGAHHSGHSGRVSLADLRRASAKLLRRKDSTGASSKKSTTTTIAATVELPFTCSSSSSSSSPPPIVPPRGSSAVSTTSCSSATATATAASGQGVIKQATVRRMSTLRHQTRSASPTRHARAANTKVATSNGGSGGSNIRHKRTGSSMAWSSAASTISSSSSYSTDSSPSTPAQSPKSSSIQRRFQHNRTQSASVEDNGSSLYMQLDKIPVAVQSQSLRNINLLCSSTVASSKRKALEDISNQAYRQIIHSLQDELAELARAEEQQQQQQEAAAADADDGTRTLAEANLLPMNQMQLQSRTNPVQEQQQLQPDGMASFTSQPPTTGDLHRPRPVRQQQQASPTSPAKDTVDSCRSVIGNRRGQFSSCPDGRPLPPFGFHFSSSPVKKACQHSSTGQHLHQQGAQVKKNRAVKSVTFDTEPYLINGDSDNEMKLPVLFETEQEQQQQEEEDSDESPSMPGFVNVPCSRRGFCLELLPHLLGPIGDSVEETGSSSCSGGSSNSGDRPDSVMDGGSGDIQTQLRNCALAASLLAPPSTDGNYDWQPSYVNLEDTEIAPVLLASSRPADDSSDFWKPKSVASGQQKLRQQQQLLENQQPVYDAPNGHKLLIPPPTGGDCDNNPLLVEFPAAFRYAMHCVGGGGQNQLLPAAHAALGRRSISNGSSGSDTQDSGVAEMMASHQPLSLSRAASASPQLVLNGEQQQTPLVYNTLPRADGKRGQQQQQLYYNYWNLQQQQQQIATASSLYATTDPHFLSTLGSPSVTATARRSTTTTMTSAIDAQDESWSSDHLYCNMASVDPTLPTLPPRISRRCHSLLALSTSRSSGKQGAGYLSTSGATDNICTDANYENLHPTTTTTSKLLLRHNVSHSRSRSLRHSGDFSPCWMLPTLPTSLPHHHGHKSLQMPLPTMSGRRQQLLYERASRLELMLKDASINDYSDTYEPSDWSMEAMLSDTPMDSSGLGTPQTITCQAHHCCCLSTRRPAPPPQCPCSSSHQHKSNSKLTSPKAVRKSLRSSPLRVRENAATQTETSPMTRSSSSAAENPLYMAYNDLTKIDPKTGPISSRLHQLSVLQADELYAGASSSDGCETWNSHKALYARLKAAATVAAVSESPKKRRSKRRAHPLPFTPSSSRIWRHEGQTVSTPQKSRGPAERRNASTRRQRMNSTIGLDLTAVSTRSTRSNRSQRRIKRRKSKAAEVLHGKGQLQLAIYLNSGLLTIHVQSGKCLKSPSGGLCNSYVKISLIPGDEREQTSCRTTLIKGDNNPWFDQKFSFEFLSADLYKRLLVSVWNRDTKKNRSDFMGCMSFSVSHVIRKDASGWYRLLNGNIGRQRHFAVRKQLDLNNSTIAAPMDMDLEEDLVVVDDSELVADQEGEESEDRRFSTVPFATAASDTASVAADPLTSEGIKGKTPYTSTMKLKRGPKGYGFSVTWTHPPRIERVEPGLAADQAGMKVGDYIVFVGSQNVVKMDEQQVLQFIQSAGDTLTLEVYRKNSKHQSTGFTSEQLTNAQLQPSPIPPTTRTPTPTAAAATTTTVVNNPCSSNANKTSVSTAATYPSHQRHHHHHHRNLVNIAAIATTTTVATADALPVAATSLKVAFNKSIGGGVLV